MRVGPSARAKWRLVSALFATAILGGLLTSCSSADSHEPKRSESALRKKFPKPIDLADARAKCLRDKGWAVEVDEDGAIAASFAANEGVRYEHDDKSCLKQLGVDPDAATPTEVVVEAYRESVEGAKCLEKEGWPISRIPTLATFEDTYETDPWYPWGEVPPEDEATAARACPYPEPTY